MTITDRVRAILQASKKARNDDRELELIYLQKSGMNLTEAQQQTFREMDDLWTVRRVRQQLQRAGEFPADPEVQIGRKAKAEASRQAALTGSTLDLEEAIESHPQLSVFLEKKPTPRPLDWRTEEPML